MDVHRALPWNLVDACGYVIEGHEGGVLDVARLPLEDLAGIQDDIARAGLPLCGKGRKIYPSNRCRRLSF